MSSLFNIPPLFNAPALRWPTAVVVGALFWCLFQRWLMSHVPTGTPLLFSRFWTRIWVWCFLIWESDFCSDTSNRQWKRNPTIFVLNKWFIFSCDSANKQKQYKKPSHAQETNCQWTLEQMKIQWHNSWWMLTKNGTVSYRIGEGPWRSSSQPTLFYHFLKSVEKPHLEIKSAKLGWNLFRTTQTPATAEN